MNVSRDGAAAAPPSSVVDASPVAVRLIDVLGPVAACGVGRAHPNICCRGGGCITHLSAPFAACDADALTFPARTRCCLLDDGAGACVDVAPVDVPEAGSVAPSHQCALPCGPEGMPAMASLGFAVCSSSAVGECEYCCSGQSCVSNVCRCPEQVDGSICDCHGPTCGACPESWQASAAQLDVCCRPGGRECFSQSTEVVDTSGGGGNFSGSGVCDLYAYKEGHVYDAACNVMATPPCRCTVDGTTTKTFASFDEGCDFRACGFPPWP